MDLSRAMIFDEQTIIQKDFMPRGISLETDEVFISDGAESDIGNIRIC